MIKRHILNKSCLEVAFIFDVTMSYWKKLILTRLLEHNDISVFPDGRKFWQLWYDVKQGDQDIYSSPSPILRLALNLMKKKTF